LKQQNAPLLYQKILYILPYLSPVMVTLSTFLLYPTGEHSMTNDKDMSNWI